MIDQDKLGKLEETLDVEIGTLKPDMELANISEYDSLARLSLLVMLDEDFGVQVPTETIKKLVTVNDILLLMEKKND